MVGSRSPRTKHRSVRWAIGLAAVLGLLASGCAVSATWTPQTVAPALPASPDRIALHDVACPATGACVAIGSRTTVLAERFVLRQNGSGWTQLALPIQVDRLGGVSCRGVDDCLISAGPIDLHVGASGITVVPPPPDDADPIAAGAPACIASGCLQILGSTSSWWNGSTWSTPATVPASMERFDRLLSCASATSCLLIGNSFPIEGWPTPGPVTSSVWNGTAWSAPVTVSSNTRVLDLACASATSCFASAGVRADYWTGGLPLPAPALLRWNGTAWSSVVLSFPGTAPSEPPSIGCASPTSCTALWSKGKSSTSPTYLGRWNGSTWTVTTTTAAASIISLGCGSTTSCVGVGGPNAQQLSGTTWSTMPIATSTSPSDVLGRVSCTTATTCMAIGVSRQLNAAGDELNAVPITRRLDGSTWVAEPPDTHPSDQVSCGSPTSCMTALGGGNSVVTRHWNGTSWQTLATVSNVSIIGVTGLSCPTATWCILTTSNFGSGEANLSWVWTGGTTWTPLPALPQQSGSSRAVSCSAPGQCVALTSWIGPQLYRLSGSTWTAVPLTGLDLGQLGELTDVDCTAPGECVVVGRKDYGADDRPIGLLGVLRNGTWTSTVRPGSMFNDVDCWSVDGCVAVGAMSWLSAQSSIETYTGSGWRPVKGSPGLSSVRNVSCGAPKTCAVTGGFLDDSSRAVVSRLHIDG